MIKIYSNIYDFKNVYYVLAFITNKCNYRCYYCYNKKNADLKELDLYQLYVYIKKIQFFTKKKIILNFIGGEPTLHSKLLEFCNFCNNDKSIKIEIITNFSKDISFFSSFPANVNFTVSFHSQHAIPAEFIQKCQRMKYQIKNIIVMFDDKELDNVLLCYDTLIESGFRSITELNLIDDKKYSNDVYLEFKKRKSVSTYFMDENDNKLQFNNIATFKRQSFKNWKCNAGVDTQYVHVDGKVYYCESYYSENKQPYTSIYAKEFKFIDHPIICNCGNCAGNYFIEKQKCLANKYDL